MVAHITPIMGMAAQPVGFVQGLSGALTAYNRYDDSARILNDGDTVYTGDVISPTASVVQSAEIVLFSGQTAPITHQMSIDDVFNDYTDNSGLPPTAPLETIETHASSSSDASVVSDLSESLAVPLVTINTVASTDILTNFSLPSDNNSSFQDETLGRDEENLLTQGGPNEDASGVAPVVLPLAIDLDSASGGDNYATSYSADVVGINFNTQLMANNDAVITGGNGTLQSMSVSITNLLDIGAEILSADTSGTGIVANYDTGTGVLTLSGTDSVANYIQVLRTIEYENTADNPDLTARVIDFFATDGATISNMPTTTVTMFCSDPNPGPPFATIFGTNGADTIVGTGGADVIAGLDANDNLRGAGGNDTIYGQCGDDIIRGNQGNDVLYGGLGNDDLRGGQNNDTLFGGRGADTMRGGGGSDSLFGGLAGDLLLGGGGADTLFGEEGNDDIRAGGGNDTIIGGAGNDILRGQNGGDSFDYFDFAIEGNDTIIGFNASDQVDLSAALAAAGLGDGDVNFSSAGGSNALITVNGFAGQFSVTLNNVDFNDLSIASGVVTS